jgi:hypothetical protein
MVQTTCYFEYVEDIMLALDKGSAETRPDVEKFSNVFPVLWVGEAVKHNTLKSLESEGIQ